MSTRRKSREYINLTKNNHEIKNKNDEILRKKLQSKTVHKMSEIRSLNIRV